MLSFLNLSLFDSPYLGQNKRINCICVFSTQSYSLQNEVARMNWEWIESISHRGGEQQVQHPTDCLIQSDLFFSDFLFKAKQDPWALCSPHAATSEINSFIRESQTGIEMRVVFVLWRSWGKWRTGQSICFQIRLTSKLPGTLLYGRVTFCMCSIDMVVGTPNVPEPHLCVEVSAALLSEVRLCCSAGQVALVLLGGYQFLCRLKSFSLSLILSL